MGLGVRKHGRIRLGWEEHSEQKGESMIRRRFIQGVAGGLAAAHAAGHSTRMVHYRIEGFTCITCAVGLDTLLKDQPGIVSAKSSYPERSSIITYNPVLISEDKIKAFIHELGFTAKPA